MFRELAEDDDAAVNTQSLLSFFQIRDGYHFNRSENSCQPHKLKRGDLYTLKLDPKLSQLLKLYCSILLNLFLNCLQGLMGSCWGEFRTG